MVALGPAKWAIRTFAVICSPHLSAGRCRRVWVEQTGGAKIGPQRGRDRMTQQPEVGVELLDVARARNDCGYRRMSERELQRRCRQGDPMAVADRLDGIDPGDDLGRCGFVVQGVAAGEDAG